MADPYIGMIFNLGFAFAPRNYATCDGQLLSIAQNSALFSLLGTTYGGNGQSTFGLPQLQGCNAIHRGQSPGGSNYAQGQTGGQENVSLTSNNLPTHTHTATYANGGGSTLTANNVRGTTNVPTAGYQLSRGYDGDGSPDSVPLVYVPTAATNQVNLSSVNVAGSVTNSVAGASAPVDLRKPYTTILTVIAIQGLYPSRN